MWWEFSGRAVRITQPPDSRQGRPECDWLRVCGAYKPWPEDTEVKGKALVLRTGSFLRDRELKLHSCIPVTWTGLEHSASHPRWTTHWPMTLHWSLSTARPVCSSVQHTWGVEEKSYPVWPLRALQIPHVKCFRKCLFIKAHVPCSPLLPTL